MNVGEISEFCFKAYMLRQRDENRKDTVFGKIDELSDDANLADLEWNPSFKESLDDNDWKTLSDKLGISKSNPYAKMYISINKIRYSMKDIGGNPPAIVNHTPRPGYENVCNDVGISIKELDIIIAEYWNLRGKKIIAEDVKNSDGKCPFLSHKAYMKKIIEYFIFDGTGAGTSSRPADAVLEIDYKGLHKCGSDMEGSWKKCMRIHDKQHCYDEVWPRLVFSVRSKQMPPLYPDCPDSKSIGKWTKKMNERDKGCLHIRYEPEKFPND